MFLTHTFSRPDSLSKARDWLDRLGISTSQVEIFLEGVPRISLFRLDLAQLTRARLLFNAIDAIDPHGPMGYYDVGRFRDHRNPAGSAEPVARPAFARTVIHFDCSRDPLPPEADWSERRDARRLM